MILASTQTQLTHDFKPDDVGHFPRAAHLTLVVAGVRSRNVPVAERKDAIRRSVTTKEGAKKLAADFRINLNDLSNSFRS